MLTMKFQSGIRIAAFLTLAVCVISYARAEGEGAAYPSRPITFIIPSPPAAPAISPVGFS